MIARFPKREREFLQKRKGVQNDLVGWLIWEIKKKESQISAN